MISAEASEARKSAALAMSIASPDRPIGCIFAQSCLRSLDPLFAEPTLTGRDAAGADAVDPDALGGPLARCGLDHSDDRALGRAVGRHPGQADQTGDRGGGDDRTAAGALKVGDAVLHPQPDAADVDVRYQVIRMFRTLENAAFGWSDSGVVVDHVDSAPGLIGGREHALHILAVAHIGLDVQRRVADVRSDPRTSLRVAIASAIGTPGSFGREEPRPSPRQCRTLRP